MQRIRRGTVRAPSNPRGDFRSAAMFTGPEINDMFSASTINKDPIRRNPAPTPDNDIYGSKLSNDVRQHMHEHGIRYRETGSMNYHTPVKPVRVGGTRDPGVIHPVYERPEMMLPNQNTRTFNTDNMAAGAHSAQGGEVYRDAVHKMREFDDMERQHLNHMPAFVRADESSSMPKRDTTIYMAPETKRPILGGFHKFNKIVSGMFHKEGANAAIVQDTKHSRRQEEHVGAPRQSYRNAGTVAIQSTIPPKLPLSAAKIRKNENIGPFFHAQMQTTHPSSYQAAPGATQYLSTPRKVEEYDMPGPRQNAFDISYQAAPGGTQYLSTPRKMEEYDMPGPRPTVFENAQGVDRGQTMVHREDHMMNVFDTSESQRGAVRNEDKPSERHVSQHVGRPNERLMVSHDHEAMHGRGRIDPNPTPQPIKPNIVEPRRMPVNTYQHLQSTVAGSGASTDRDSSHNLRNANMVVGATKRQNALDFKAMPQTSGQRHRMVKRVQSTPSTRFAASGADVSSTPMPRFVGSQNRKQKL